VINLMEKNISCWKRHVFCKLRQKVFIFITLSSESKIKLKHNIKMYSALVVSISLAIWKYEVLNNKRIS